MKQPRTRRRRDPDQRVEQWKPRGRFSGSTYINTTKIKKAAYDAQGVLSHTDLSIRKIVLAVENPTASSGVRDSAEREIKYLRDLLTQALYYVDLANKEIRR